MSEEKRGFCGWVCGQARVVVFSSRNTPPFERIGVQPGTEIKESHSLAFVPFHLRLSTMHSKLTQVLSSLLPHMHKVDAHTSDTAGKSLSNLRIYVTQTFLWSSGR